MIPNQEKTVNISGSSNLAQARTQQMGIDSLSLPHLMKVLTNLYSDPEMAVIREISTNAYDSHVEAGKGHVPIQVSLPNVFSPEFIVKDFGVGMSEQEVFDVFGMYGASTKRESNDYVGQLGLGCKSPLTLTNQFSLTAIKGGVKCIFSVHLDEMGIGKITKLHEENTTEPNGVEVSVPVPNTNTFVRKARKFYRFFPVMPKFAGGVNFPEEMVPQTIVEIDSTTRVIKSIYDDEQHDFVIMGGVAYPYRSERGYRRFRVGTIVMEAPIGAVDFTPSREELHLTGRTKAFIEERYQKVEEVFAAQVQAKLNAAKDIYEFQKLLADLQHDLRTAGINKVRFNGIDFDSDIGTRVVVPRQAQILSLNPRESRLVDISNAYGNLHISHLEKTATVINDTKNDEITSYTRTRLKLWMETNNISFAIVLPEGVDFSAMYMDRVNEGGSLVEIRKNANKLIQKAQPTGTYEKVDSSTWNGLATTQTAPDTANCTVVFAPRKFLKGLDDNIINDLVSIVGLQVFVINKSRKAKFMTDYPKAIQIDRFVYNKASKLLDTLKGQTELAIHNKHGYSSPLSKLNLPYSRMISKTDQITDSELRFALEFIGNMNNSAFSEVRRRVKTHLGILVKSQDSSEFDNDVTRAELTLLTQKNDTVGQKEAKEVADLLARMQAKYPLILHQHSKEQYLIDYANMIAKGA